jgi:plasmid rolling circle replication initiator protein Rep
MSNNPNLYKTKKLPEQMLAEFDTAARLKRLKSISVADYRSERGEAVAALLEKYCAADNNEVVKGYAERLRACAARYNYYLGEDFVDPKTGELFSGFGTLFGCGLKLCPNCTARAARRNRAIAQRVIENTELQNREHYCHVTDAYIVEKERYRFVTLTMPQVFATFKTTMKIQKRAWDLFRKLKIVKDYFAAIVKSIEFTVRKNRTYHDHMHLLAITFFLPEKLLKQAWTDCVRTAFQEFGIEFVAKQANVNMKLVVPTVRKGEENNEITYDNAIQETCKYLTKATTWAEIPADQLIEIAEIERWDRMFELSGRFRQTIQRLKAEDAAADSCTMNNKAPLTDSVARELDYFNTDGITDGDHENASENFDSAEEIPAEKPKRESWRDVIRRDGLEKYLEKFYRQLEYAQKIRKLRLILKYPDAVFTDLDGRAWDLLELERFALSVRLQAVDIPN